MKQTVLASLLLLTGACASPPPAPPSGPVRPAWMSGPAFFREHEALVFVGVGEDRTLENAGFKAEAIALQDVANECSFVPIGTAIEPHHPVEEVGIIQRAYARVTVPAAVCEKARVTTAPAAIRALADPALQQKISRYQTEYDPPELSEVPGGDTGPLDPYSRYYALRQQVALAKQKVVLNTGAPANIGALTQALEGFAKSHIEVTTVPHAFSERRPNVTAHQPSAVRDTIAERKRIEAEYPETPLPKSRPRTNPGGRGRGGGRHRRGMPEQPTPTPTPTATPSPSPSP